MKNMVTKYESGLFGLITVAVLVVWHVEGQSRDKDGLVSPVDNTPMAIPEVDVSVQDSPFQVESDETQFGSTAQTQWGLQELTSLDELAAVSEYLVDTDSIYSQVQEEIESTSTENVFEGSFITKPTVIDLNIPIVEENMENPTRQLPLEYQERLSEALSMDVSFSLSGVPGTTILNLKSASLPDIREAAQNAADQYNRRLTERSMPNTGLVPDGFRISAIVFP